MATKKPPPVNKDIEQAWSAIRDIFECYGSCEPVKENLWEILKRALTNEQDQTTATERANMIWSYEKIKALLDAVWALASTRSA
jgi:hypothetical protein